MAVTAAQVKVEFRSDGADKVAGDLRSLGKETNAAAKEQGFLASAASTAMGVVGGGLILGAIGKVKEFGASAIGAGLSFEQGMANVAAVTGATGTELKTLSDLALKIGKDTAFGANEATLAIEELAKAGVSTESILHGAADGAVALAAAGGVALPEAAAVMSAALNQFGLDGTQATHVADLLAAAAATSATGVSELGESLTYVGTTAHALSIPIEDIVTALAAMGDQGLIGSMAGTALNQALLHMTSPTDTARAAMDALGVSFVDVNGAMKPLPQIVSELAAATAGLSDTARMDYLTDIFDVQGARAMNALLATQTDAAKAAGKSWEDYYASVNQSGAAAQQAAARMDNTLGSIEQLKGSLETLAIIGSMMVLPMFRGMIDGAAKGVDAFTGLITSVQSLIAGGNDPFTAISLAMRGFLTDLFGLDVMNALMPFVDGFLDVAETITGIVQDLAGVVGDVLGAAFGFLGDNISAVMGAISGVIALFAGIFAWAGLTAIVSGLAAAFAALVSPLGLLVLAAAALGVAWQTNFLGIQDKVRKGFEKLKPTLRDTRVALDALINGDWATKGRVMQSAFTHLGNGVKAIGTAIPFLKGPMDWLGGALQGIPSLAADAGRQFKSFLDQGLNPVAAGFGTLGVGFQKLADMFPQFSGFFSGMRDQMTGWMGVAQDLGTGLVDLFRGDLSGAMLAFGNAATQVWDNVVNGLQTLATGAMELGSWVLNVGAPTVIGWLADAAGNVWDALKVAAGWAGEVLADLGAWTLNVAAPAIVSAGWSLLGKLQEWLFGTGPSDGTGGQGYATGGFLVELGSWTLSVAAPLIQGVVDIAALILAKIVPLTVTVGDWTLNVAFPNIVLFGWNVTDAINRKVQQNYLIPLHDWILSLDAPDVVLAFGNLAQLIRSKITPGTAIDLGKIAVMVGLAPIVALDTLTGLPAMVISAVIDQMPKDVKHNLAVTVNIVGAIIKDAVGLAASVLAFAATQLAVALNLSAPLNVTITALNFLGIAADVFNPFTNGLGFKGTIDLIMPDWHWPDLPTWEWPSLPTWTWPEIPVPGWVSDLISALGGGGGPQSGGGTDTPGGGAGSGGSGGAPGGGPIHPLGSIANLGMGKYDQTGNRDITITIKQVGAEAVAAAAAIAQAAIAAIPTSTTVTITQVGAEMVAAAAVIAQAAILMIPTSHLTAILQVGGEAVAAAAVIAQAAILAIPTSHHTTISQSGAEGVAAAAAIAAAAIAAIPSSKTVTINTVNTVTTAVVGSARAVGGYVTGGLTRLAELGPELVALPNGSWMMALRDALYPTPMGSYVYTAGQTRAMQASLMPVGAYASGGYVGGRGSAPRPGGPTVIVNVNGDTYGVDHLKTEVGGAVIQALAEESARRNRALGVRR